MAQQDPQRRGSTAPCRRTDDPSRAAPDIGDTRLADMHIVSSGGSTLRKHSATLSDWAEPCNSEDPPQRDAGPAVSRSPPSGRGDRPPLPDRDHLAGSATGVRILAEGVEAAPPVLPRRHVGPAAAPLAGCGRRRRGVRLAGLGRLHRGAGGCISAARRPGGHCRGRRRTQAPPTGLVTSADEAPVHQGPKPGTTVDLRAG